jgi:uncharacterized membrane protein
MNGILAVHILTGSLGILSGFVALYTAKGLPLHRKAGMVFVYVMLTMAVTGAVIAVTRGAGPTLNVPAALTTAYLVFTGVTTVRPLPKGGKNASLVAMFVALLTGLVALSFAFAAIAGGGVWKGIPAFAYFMFAPMGILGAAGDLRMMRAGGIRGVPRIARHLWRMSLALFVATMSFFIGQAKVIPEPYRIRPLLALPVLAVLVTMLYWVWRVRFRPRRPRFVPVAAPELS